MLLVDHCITYLCPIADTRRAAQLEQQLNMDEAAWEKLSPEQLSALNDSLYAVAETSMFYCASDLEKQRIALLSGGHNHEWFVDECESRNLPIRYWRVW